MKLPHKLHQILVLPHQLEQRMEDKWEALKEQVGTRLTKKVKWKKLITSRKNEKHLDESQGEKLMNEKRRRQRQDTAQQDYFQE